MTAPARRRFVGAALRRYREARGYTLEDAARVLECDKSRISRIETGERGIRPRDLRDLLTEYGSPQETRDTLVAVADQHGTAGWHKNLPGRLPGAYRDFLTFASAASRITAYEAQRVPEFLQAPQYARALAEADPALTDDDARETAVQAALGLQKALAATRPGIHMITGEAALHQDTGGHATMKKQLGRLAAASGGGRITVQILPFTAHAHAAPWAGSLMLFEFAGTPDLRAVRTGSALGGTFLLDDTNVTATARTLDRLKTLALSPQRTALKLRDLTARSARRSPRPA